MRTCDFDLGNIRHFVVANRARLRLELRPRHIRSVSSWVVGGGAVAVRIDLVRSCAGDLPAIRWRGRDHRPSRARNPSGSLICRCGTPDHVRYKNSRTERRSTDDHAAGTESVERRGAIVRSGVRDCLLLTDDHSLSMGRR